MFERNRFFNKFSISCHEKAEVKGEGHVTSYYLWLLSPKYGYFPKASQSNGNYK